MTHPASPGIAAQPGKRFHVHVSVADLAGSLKFYSTLFGAQPSVVKPDYAKWMLDDPRINFAISARGATPGVDHLGFQLETDAQLLAARAQLQSADIAVLDAGETSCCYANSDKHWVTDPSGIAWETFRTLGEVPTFNGGKTVEASAPAAPKAACCPPAAVAVAAPASSCAAKTSQTPVTGCAPKSGCC